MMYDDTKIRAQVREETLRDVATWCAERMDEAFGLWLRGRQSAFLDVMNHCLSLEAETVAASHRPVPAWTSVDGGLDG